MKPRDEKKINQVFGATLKLVREMGLSGITMSDIAREAGMATGTVYIYFKNKGELINALYAECRKSSARLFFRDYDEQRPFKTSFRTIFFNILRHRIEHLDEAIFIEQCHHSPFISEKTRKEARKLLAPLFSLIERGKSEQLVKDLDTILLLQFMVGSINEVVKQYHYNNKKITPALRESLFALSWDGLRR